MPDAELGPNRYGKSGIRLAKVVRDAGLHTFADLTVDVWLDGDFAAAHVDGDNRAVLPTDTMRGTVYALAAQHPATPIEAFGLRLGRRFLDASAAARTAEVHLAEQVWDRLPGAGGNHAFTRAAGGLRTAVVTVLRDGIPTVQAGVRDWFVLKTTGSAFTDFLVDEYTTLPEAADRILATAINARWRYLHADVDYDSCAARVRAAAGEAFAGHDDSQSLQHTEWAMGSAVLAACPEVAEISFSCPNQHHLGVDLAPYGLDDDRSVFVVADRPYGVIEATVRRPGAAAR